MKAFFLSIAVLVSFSGDLKNTTKIDQETESTELKLTQAESDGSENKHTFFEFTGLNLAVASNLASLSIKSYFTKRLGSDCTPSLLSQTSNRANAPPLLLQLLLITYTYFRTLT